MNVRIFIENYREAFGPAAELPIAFWYSDRPLNRTEKIGGCFFKGLGAVRSGQPISLSAETIGCGGGKFYTGFAPMPEHVPNFVSLKEKYKQTPEMVLEFIRQLDPPAACRPWLNFSRIDTLDSFDAIEGLLFLATPDVLSGLTTWAWFDNNAPDAVSTLFGSGCSAVVTQAVVENRTGGRRTFLGLFDPSVRPHVGANELSFVIPRSRLGEMYHTIRECCLFDTHAWEKVRQRIAGQS